MIGADATVSGLVYVTKNLTYTLYSTVLVCSHDGLGFYAEHQIISSVGEINLGSNPEPSCDLCS